MAAATLPGVPTYEYECTSCGQHIEVFQRFSEDPLTTCGVCGGALRKVFHPAGIVFKGSGFYATDSRSKPASSEPKGEKKDGKPAAPAASDGGSKAAEAAKPETKKPDTKASSS
jgi:putative FmdB family regulatory protein